MRAADSWNPIFKNLSEAAIDRKEIYHSQQGEIGIINAIFELCKPQNKWCVEFGAGDGKNLSNTYDLIQKGWYSVQIEAREDEYKKLKELYQNNKRVIVLEKLVGIPINTYNLKYAVDNDIETILDSVKVPLELDFMSIDVDSYDYEVWLNMKRYAPNIICIECNAVEEDFDVLNYDPSWTVKTKENMWYGGATVGLLNRLAREKGYDLICVEWCNAIYIKKGFGKPLLK